MNLSFSPNMLDNKTKSFILLMTSKHGKGVYVHKSNLFSMSETNLSKDLFFGLNFFVYYALIHIYINY
jgi:hypothetical protein